MDLKVGTILLFLVVVICPFANAKTSFTLDIIITPTEVQAANDTEDPKADSRSEQVCTLCEEYANMAIQYLSDSERQSEIISSLHQACSHLHALKHQCIAMVDYYTPLFFMEISTIQPALFCEKLSLCEMVSVHQQNHDNACTVCQRIVTQVLTKLEDPETQLDIIQTLLKGCNKLEGFVQECKKLVFEYGPIILSDAEKFFESTDICAAIRVCKAHQETPTLQELLFSSA